MDLYRGFMRFLAFHGHAGFNQRLGIEPTQRLSLAWNRLWYSGCQRERERLYREELGSLLAAHDGYTQALPDQLMRDGFVIDRSRSLPHLQGLLRESEELIAERGGQDRSASLDAQQPWFYPLLRDGDLSRFPSFVEFGLSSPVIATLAHEMGCLPYFSKPRPPALRLMESNAQYDRESGRGYRESQLFHLDIHAAPLIYAIVLLRDTDMDSGPWHFLSASTSRRIAAQLRYQQRGVSYRLTDDVVLPRIGADELHVFTGKAGDVLFIDSSRCFHYGSRDSRVPRYQMMYAYTSAIRADLYEYLLAGQERPLGPAPSRLRQLVFGPKA